MELINIRFVVKLFQRGSKQAVSFPELTVLAGNIDDVEIITAPAAAAAASPIKSNPPASSAKPAYNSLPSNGSPYATPSVYASKAHTFPAGNARHTLPHEEFDFAANLARFDKATEFKKIQSEDLVPRDERLVAINSPQRKLGIHENVLEAGGVVVKIAKKPSPAVPKSAGDDPLTPAAPVASSLRQSTTSTSTTATATASTSPIPISVADEIMEKFKHLAVPTTGKGPSKVFVEEDSSSSESEAEPEPEQGPRLPMMDSDKFNTIFQEKADTFRTIAALNFSHHLLAELDASRPIVLLLGVHDSAAILMETFHHLCSHGRLENAEIHAIFAAGGKGSAGKKIELSSATKAARKRLISQERVKFTTNLGDIIKLTNVTVFDALGPDGELTQNAVKGLTDWMKKLLLAATTEKKTVYGIESVLLKKNTANSIYGNLQLVTFGMARDTLTPSLQVSRSILYVDAGLPATEETREIFNASFVTEIEY